MRRGFRWLICLTLLLAAAACSTGGDSTFLARQQGQTYRDSTGWTLMIPRGWYVVRFSDSKDGIASAGVQLSNVRLPRPSLLPGFPIQVNDQVLPPRGVGLIIATDTDPKLSHGTTASLTLPRPNGPEWTMGSAPGGTPYLETLWFLVKGSAFVASAKIGPGSTTASLKALAAVVHSLR
jgi:hypothetical protein